MRNFDVEVELTIVCLNQARKAQIPSQEIWRVVHRAATMRVKPIAVQGFSIGNHAIADLPGPPQKTDIFRSIVSGLRSEQKYKPKSAS
ncbi:MAG: hypothetical protein DME46_08415 [Verrucomicrobia bacterium]|nr:MAG: hypothetical protein DME46_08415 [Verrucomicrobiota bacterium]